AARNGAGNPIEVVGAWSDVTARKQLAEALAAAQERLVHLLSCDIEREPAGVAQLAAAGLSLDRHEIAARPATSASDQRPRKNPHYGTPGNPADRTRVPGGSSSGAAVAVADGMCEIAIGTDTCGSTRIPAAFCGAVGHKPTKSRVSTEG